MPPSASKSSPGREPDGRQRELVEAAYAQIAEVGLEGLRTRDVAARVGINVATLHYHYPSKQALVVAVVQYVNELFKRLRQPPVEGQSIIENILHTSRHRAEVAPELHVVLLELGVRSARDPVIAAAMGQNQTEWRGWMEREIRQEIASGVLRPDLDARAVAAFLASTVIGVTMQLQMNPQAFEFEAVMRHLESLLVAPGAKKKPVARRKAR